MTSEKFLNKTAAINNKIAWEIIEETGIIHLWESIGATVNPVGSLKSGLMVKKLDIDLHIYTDELNLSESFSVIQKFAENQSVKRIEYCNRMDTDEECIEWHVYYQDYEQVNLWKLDMIHLRKGSAFDGFIERVTDRVIQLLTPETREAIMQIKYNLPDDTDAKGIEIYQAVLVDGIRTMKDFLEWRKNNSTTGVVDWLS